MDGSNQTGGLYTFLRMFSHAGNDCGNDAWGVWIGGKAHTDEEIAIEMFETLLDDFDAIPSVLQKCIRKKIIPDFDRLTRVYARMV